MWQTDFKLAQRHVPALAKIKPITVLDGGYRIGYIHKDTDLFSVQLSSQTLPLERVEKWIALTDLETIIDRWSDTSLIRMVPKETDPLLSRLIKGLKEQEDKGNLEIIASSPQGIWFQSQDPVRMTSENAQQMGLELEETDRPTIRPMREGIIAHDLGGEG